jgi:hypothetical protein
MPTDRQMLQIAYVLTQILRWSLAIALIGIILWGISEIIS